MAFVKFMSSPVGRIVRIVAGVALIAVGAGLGGSGGIVLAVVGLVPLAAGVFDVCVLAPLLHQPFTGKRLRSHVADR
jgi:hypothetical protein